MFCGPTSFLALPRILFPLFCLDSLYLHNYVFFYPRFPWSRLPCHFGARTGGYLLGTLHRPVDAIRTHSCLVPFFHMHLRRFQLASICRVLAQGTEPDFRRDARTFTILVFWAPPAVTRPRGRTWPDVGGSGDGLFLAVALATRCDACCPFCLLLVRFDGVGLPLLCFSSLCCALTRVFSLPCPAGALFCLTWPFPLPRGPWALGRLIRFVFLLHRPD